MPTLARSRGRHGTSNVGVGALLLALLGVAARPAAGLLWFADPPNNLGDFDGLTTKDGKFYLRYNNVRPMCPTAPSHSAAGMTWRLGRGRGRAPAA